MWTENLIAARMAELGFSISANVHTLENIRKISQISLERKWSSWRFQELATGMLNLEMVVTEEKTLQIRRQ